MKEIKGVGFVFPNEENSYINIDSFSSLSECDIVLFDASLGKSYYTNDSYNGKPAYEHDASIKITEHSEHWQREIRNYLKSGKTLFINLSALKSFFIQTGQKTYSGTGRNRQTTHLVAPYTNYQFMPKFDGIEFNIAHGDKVISEDSIFIGFLNDFQEFICYETYINTKLNFIAKFTTKSKDKLLGGLLNFSGGNIVFLPNLNLNNSKLKTSEGKWTKEAKILSKKLYHHLLEIDKSLNNHNEITPRPEWIKQKDYALKKSEEINIEINDKNNTIDKLKNEIEILNVKYIESEKLNNLLFETGKQLELAVTLALQLLGYKAENFDNGILELDQIIISPEGERYIGECEGKDNKQIDITKFRQLSDALNEDFEREDVNEKAYGLLFGNPFRLINPTDRKDPFTTKCISGAKRESIGLIETKEIYAVVKYLSENPDEDFKVKCRETIKKGLGEIIKFPHIPK